MNQISSEATLLTAAEYSYDKDSDFDPDKQKLNEGIMDSTEKLRRALADDWEFVGDPWQLCLILREEIHRLIANPALKERIKINYGSSSIDCRLELLPLYTRIAIEHYQDRLECVTRQLTDALGCDPDHHPAEEAWRALRD